MGLVEALHDVKSYVLSKQTPDGYYGKYVQVVDLLRSTGDLDGFCRGNAIKYIARWGRKDEIDNVDDLHKAIHYLLILIMENTNGNNQTNV